MTQHPSSPRPSSDGGSSHQNPPKPLLMKSLVSFFCGLASIPACFCAGFPSLVLGALALWLGIYVKKNFRGSTASEIANIYAWLGMICGVIGIILGLIIVLGMLTGGAVSVLDQTQ